MAETSSSVPLVVCFKLGRALRYGDVESFFQIYDSMDNLDVSDTIFEQQLTTIKETARQISELDFKDYAILVKATGPLQLSSNLLDVHEPVAAQLALVIEQSHLNDQGGSDSGAISDYESSVCSIEESIKSADFDLGSLDRICTSKGNVQFDEETASMNIAASPFIEGVDTSSQVCATEIKGTQEDPLCSLETNDQSNDSWPETLWSFKTDMNSRSTRCLPNVDTKDKPIKVAELEKYFFTLNSDTTLQPVGLNEESSNDTTFGPAYSMRPHWKSQLHFRNEDNWEIILVYPKHRHVEIPCTPPNIDSFLKQNHIQVQSSDQLLSAKGVNKIEEKRSISRDGKSRTGKERSFSCRQRQHEPQHREKEQSPLTLHSQNTRTNFRKDVVRPSFRWHNRNQHHFRYKCKDKEFMQYKEFDQDDKEFNHYEVVQFLLEGWENARKEFLRKV